MKILLSIFLIFLKKIQLKGCIDENNKPASFMAMFKFPRSLLKDKDDYYMLFTPKMKKISIMPNLIDSENSPLDNTF